MDRRHDPRIADQIGDVWEVHPNISGEIIREPDKEQFWHNNMYLKIPSIEFDVFVPKRGSTIFVTEEGKEYIEQKSEGWVTAEECTINDKGQYVVYEWDKQKIPNLHK